MKNKDIKDFYENDYFSYESHCDLWGDEKILLLIDFGDVPNKSEMLLKHIDKIYDNHQNEIELVISCNDEMALGCSDYLKTLPDYDSSQTILDQYFPIIGVNGRSLGIEAIKNGDIYGTVTNDSIAQADAIYQLSMRLLNNQSLSDFPYTFERGKFIRTKGEILTLDTLKERQLI